MDGLDALKISEEKKKYIVDLLNPILEEMVAECIHRMPEDPVPFMLDWLETKRVSDEDKMLSPEEKERLAKENKALAENVDKVKSQMHEAAKLAVDKNADAEDEEEEDDNECDEPPPGFGEYNGTFARTSVSAEAYGEWNAKKSFVPPVIPKTDDQKDRLKKTLGGCFLFNALDSNDMSIIIGAMEEKTTKPKQRVINQGEMGDILCVIESGKFDCLKKGDDGAESIIKTCEAGDVFGELALLYNCPRAATVESQDKGVVWQLDRETFNHIVKDAAQKKRQRYDAFLSKVPLLNSMSVYERSQLADALCSETFSDGQTIVSQGEVGHKFYIIEEGEAVATKNGVQVMSYQAGDYFGELALILNQPRAATVICKGISKMLVLDSACFKRLLNVSDLLDRSEHYKKG